jgi:phenylalanyl-tRNA synthetase beta chain
MKFSYSWLAEMVPGLTATAREAGQQITMKTAETEGVEDYAPHLAEVCAARVLSVEPIPNSPNVKAVADTGRYGVKTVVCGAPNCREGMLTAYWPLGKKKIAGIESDGMLCAADELGVNRDHDRIVELEGVEPGAPVPGLRPDSIIEIDNKSLTHRPDLWGHFGMAREVAAHFGRPLQAPFDLALLPGGEPGVDVAVQDFELCSRFSAVRFENVKVGPSPEWLQFRLQSIGLNPINNIVDITNYVMAEIPQPMHAFDAGKVPGHRLVARAGRDGESCRALNGETYAVDPSMIVVAGAEGPLAIAGVMGGASSMIDESTTGIIFEAANWHAATIRKTSSRLKLRTDASMRFEKSLDPENTVQGLARAIALMKECCPGARLAGGLADVRTAPAVPPPIRLPLPWLNRKLGREAAPAEVERILTSIGFGVAAAPGELEVTVPSWRATKDVSIPADLVEEVGRMVGYASITPAPPLAAVAPPPANPRRAFHNRWRRLLQGYGFTEVQNYSFVSHAEARRFGWPAEAHLKVLNPIAENQALLRVSLIPGIHRNLEENRKHRDAFRIFEIGHEIHKRPGSLPDEVPHLVAAMYGKGDGVGELRELRRVAAILPGVRFEPAAARVFEHPRRAAEVVWHGETVGRLFEFHPTFIEAGRGAVLDLDLLAVEAIEGRQSRRYTPVRRFPSSSFDLSIIIGGRTPVGDVAKDLPDGEFIESYPLPDDRRSVLFRVTVFAEDRTLTGEEIAGERSRRIESLRAKGYELRA